MFFLSLFILLTVFGVLEVVILKARIMKRALLLGTPEAVMEDIKISIFLVVYTLFYIGTFASCMLAAFAFMSLIEVSSFPFALLVGVCAGYGLNEMSLRLERMYKKKIFSQEELEKYESISRSVRRPRR